MEDQPKEKTKMSENEQVELIFLKFGLAESDHELELSVDRYLPAILGKVASPDEKVRAKVMQLLTHISNRLKSRSGVRLPVARLLELYKNGTSTFIVNFAIIYIKMGFLRLSPAEQVELAPKLFEAMEGKPVLHQDALMRLLIAIFPLIKLPESPERRKDLFQFEKSPQSTKRLLEFCMDVLLMPYSVVPGSSSESTPRPSTAPAGRDATSSSSSNPPGLSSYGMKRLAADSPESSWNISQIEQIKVGILNLFAGDVFLENEIAVHLIVASSDTRHTVSTNADMELKKRQGSLDWNNAGVIGSLFRLYLGDAQARAGTRKNQKVNLSIQRKPVHLRTKLKIVQNLLRSRNATERFPLTVQLVYDALFAEGTSLRLRILGLEFVHHICDSCDLSKLLPQSPLILDAMLKTTKGFEGEPRTQGLAYTAMGKLSNRVPALFSSNLKLVQDAFQALSQERAQELKLYIQEALAMMSSSYRTVPVDQLPLVEAVIAKYISDPDHLCRLAAVRYAGIVFSTNHVSSRYLLLLAASDVKEDVAAEAKRLLYGGDTKGSLKAQNETGEEAQLPKFAEMLNFVHDKAKNRMRSSKCYQIGTQSIAFPPSTFLVLLQFLRKCLLRSANADSAVSVTLNDDPISEAHVIAEYIEKEWSKDRENIMELITKYLQLTMQLLKPVTDTNATYILLEMFAVCPDDFPVDILLAGEKKHQDQIKQEEHRKLVLSRIEWIKSLVQHTREVIREYGSELYSVVLKRLPASEVDQNEVLSELLAGAESDKNFEKKHGSILTLGHILGDWFCSIESNQEMMPQVMRDALICLLKHATVRDTTIAAASCFALGEIVRKTALPIPDGQIADNDEEKEKDDKEKFVVTNDLTKSDVLTILLSHIKSSASHKLRERSVIALGNFPVGDSAFPHTEYLLNSLLKSSEIKETDLHFTVATAFCNIALGHNSSTKQSKWKLIKNGGAKQKDNEKEDMVSWLIQKILKEYINHRIPAARQASCIWLLTLLKTEELANHPAIRNVLPDIQSAFMSLLSESDDLIQDVASKGLGVVYELGTEEQKKLLVDALVASLMSGSTHTSKTNQENLFQSSKGIGKAPDGSKLSTYKEICSLASDLNQPDLVYKFLHLAKHHALWNSKKGAAFGFSNIASLARDQLAPHLPRIVPRLYRYTFDPQAGVRAAMTSIWNALAPDPKKLVDQHLKAVTEDLKTNLASSIWRTRQASCLAVADLLRGGRWLNGGEESDIIISAIPDLWSATLRVLDDIKETVREAATVASKALKKITIRLCDHDQGKLGEKAVASILPVLLKEGLSSRVKEVKSLSLSTLVEVSKKSGKQIKCCIPQMIIALLEALSEFEPEVLNYLAVRSDQDGREALDLARAEAAKSSPMVETIDRCLYHADRNTLEQLIPSVTELTKKNTGVMTKAGCSHVFVSLVNHSGNDLTPYASSILSALMSGLSDNSLAVRKCNSNAIGHVAKVAKDVNVVKILTRLKMWYLEKEDDIHQHASASACHAIGKHSPDTLRAHANLVLPLAFLGMHESDKGKNDARNSNASLVKKEDKNSAQFLWKDLWTEFTPGTATAIKLYLDELITFASVALQSSQWKMKAQAAAAMATIARQQREGTIVGMQLRKLLEILLHGLQGRTWDGKEKLLTALCAVAVHCKSELRMEEVTAVLTMLFKECRRDKLIYKTEAIRSLGSVLEAHSIDKFTHFWAIIHPILRRDSSNDSDSDDASNKGQSKTNDLKIVLLETAIQACGKAWPHEIETQEQHFIEVGKLLCEHITLSTWNVQVAALQAIRRVLKVMLQPATDPSAMDVADKELKNGHPTSSRKKLDLEKTGLVEAVCVSLGNAKYSRIREEGLLVSQLLVGSFEGGIFEFSSREDLIAALQESPLFEKKSSRKTQVDELIKKLKDITQAS